MNAPTFPANEPLSYLLQSRHTKEFFRFVIGGDELIWVDNPLLGAQYMNTLDAAGAAVRLSLPRDSFEVVPLTQDFFRGWLKANSDVSPQASGQLSRES
jgi:hypothetical protein